MMTLYLSRRWIAVPLILSILGLILGLILAVVGQSEVGLIAVTCILGYTIGQNLSQSTRIEQLSNDLQQLRNALSLDWEKRRQPGESAESKAGPDDSGEAPVDVATLRRQSATFAEKADKPDTPALSSPETSAETDAVFTEPAAQPTHREETPATERPGPFASRDAENRTSTFISRFLTDGSLFVRIGILLLFFGAAFLVKLAAEKMVFPIEMRLSAIAVLGVILVLAGWRLRQKARHYAMALQGGGFGLVYITVYAAFRLYQLLPASTAFSLMVVTSVTAGLLALKQNAQVLMALGITGGFIAPVLASTGSGNHVHLFSYYAVLNVTILGMAWFKAWRIPNLLGFAFTWVIGGYWGISHYQPAWFNSSEFFLILFFVFFVALSILYALRQSPDLKGLVDGTLVFGTPVIAFGLQAGLVKPYAYGAAWSAAITGAFYIALYLILRRFDRQKFRLLNNAFLALGIVFLSLAIPFATDAQQTSAAWALEGAGIFWIGCSQSRRWQQLFGLLLQFGAGLSFLLGDPPIHASVFANSSFIGITLIALAGFLSAFAWQGTRPEPTTRAVERILMAWGMSWWLGGSLDQITRHFDRIDQLPVALAFAAGTGIVFNLLAEWRRWPSARSASFVLPLTLVPALVYAIADFDHPFDGYGLAGWAFAFAASYWLLRRTERMPDLPRWPALHVSTTLVLVAILNWELVWRVQQHMGPHSAWSEAAWVIVPALLIFLSQLQAGWPFRQHPGSYLVTTSSVLFVYLFCWSIISAGIDGSGQSWPYLPLLNPIDTAQLVLLSVLARWHSTLTRDKRIVAGLSRSIAMLLVFAGFVWLNAMLLRSVHYWQNIPYELDALLASVFVQTALSIAWSLTGVTLMWLSTGKPARRSWWLSGSALLAAVVIKLFLVDLAATGTVERILSFLSVGLLLILIGYFAPIPPSASNRKQPES